MFIEFLSTGKICALCCLLAFVYFCRYFYPFVSTSTDLLLVKWDDDEGTSREITIIIWNLVVIDRIPRLAEWGRTTSVSTHIDKFHFFKNDMCVQSFQVVDMCIIFAAHVDLRPPWAFDHLNRPPFPAASVDMFTPVSNRQQGIRQLFYPHPETIR